MTDTNGNPKKEPQRAAVYTDANSCDVLCALIRVDYDRHVIDSQTHNTETNGLT